MISPESLRRYPFFGAFDEQTLKAVAMLADEEALGDGQLVYESGEPAGTAFLLADGCVETYLVVEDPDTPGRHKKFYLGDVNPGELFGISALVEPYQHTTTTRVSGRARVIHLNAEGLRRLAEENPRMGFLLMQQVAKSALERLHNTRIELAATRP